MQLLRTLVAVSSLLCTASALVAAEPPAARDVDVENDPRSLWGDLEHLVPSGPVVDGCKILPCATDLLKTSAACLAAVAADLGSVVADLSCISVALNDVQVVPKDCANCPEAIAKYIKKEVKSA